MNNKLKTLFFGLSVFVGILLSQTVFASGDGGHGPAVPDKSVVYAVINFIILIGLLYYVLKKPAKEFFKGRSVDTKDKMTESKKAYDEAYRQFEEIEAKLKRADEEGKGILTTLKEEAELEKQRIVVQAKSYSEKLKSDAQMIAKNEVDRAKISLRAEAVKISAQLAKQKLSNINANEHANLSNEFIANIGKVS